MHILRSDKIILCENSSNPHWFLAGCHPSSNSRFTDQSFSFKHLLNSQRSEGRNARNRKSSTSVRRRLETLRNSNYFLRFLRMKSFTLSDVVTNAVKIIESFKLDFVLPSLRSRRKPRRQPRRRRVYCR